MEEGYCTGIEETAMKKGLLISECVSFLTKTLNKDVLPKSVKDSQTVSLELSLVFRGTDRGELYEFSAVPILLIGTAMELKYKHLAIYQQSLQL